MLTTSQVKMLAECSLVEIWHIEVVLKIVFTTFMRTIFTHQKKSSQLELYSRTIVKGAACR